jgi:hypothetical protein
MFTHAIVCPPAGNFAEDTAILTRHVAILSCLSLRF